MSFIINNSLKLNSRQFLKYPESYTQYHFAYCQQQNLLNMFQFFKQDSDGRPIYKRVEPTLKGSQIYIYHAIFTSTGKRTWRIGSDFEGQNCWVYCNSKGCFDPLRIRKEGKWKELVGERWVVVTDFSLTSSNH